MNARVSAADRAAVVGDQRRRRRVETLDDMADLKLAIPNEVRDQYKDTHQFRWVNSPRIRQLTERDDYDLVQGVEPVPIGKDEHGREMSAHLCIKPIAYFKADQAEKEEKRRELERASFARRDAAEADDRDPFYATKENRIGRG